MGRMALIDDELRQPLTDGTIVERIVAAVMEQKVAAGAKLPEAPLCEAFDSSRTQIRRVLIVLAERGVVTLQANRGAFVASPNAEEARNVFEARRAVERATVLAASQRIDAATLAELSANARASGAAEARGDRRESIRLSGQFHLRLAETAGNSVLTKFLEELVARTSLIIGLYGSFVARSCSEAEHGALVDALAARDGALAADLMQSHLTHVERSLDIRDAADAPADIRSVFSR
jgi:DNA-binding GntR family transcriptional regulator